MLAKGLKLRPTMPPDKGKAIASPSSPSNGSDKSVSSQMHLKDDCFHVINDIRPKGLAKSKEKSWKSKGDRSNQGNIAYQSGKYGFGVLFYLLLMTIDFRIFEQHVLFWIYE
jgi:hypothetical protein